MQAARRGKSASPLIVTLKCFLISVYLRKSAANYLPKHTLTCPPGGIRDPAGGDCVCPTPLPLTSSSSPADSASSSATRNDLPWKSGTSTPPATSRTTVPRGCSGALKLAGCTVAADAVVVDGVAAGPDADLLVAATVRSLGSCCIGAGAGDCCGDEDCSPGVSAFPCALAM